MPKIKYNTDADDHQEINAEYRNDVRPSPEVLREMCLSNCWCIAVFMPGRLFRVRSQLCTMTPRGTRGVRRCGVGRHNTKHASYHLRVWAR
jgi:hypothetical protein